MKYWAIVYFLFGIYMVGYSQNFATYQFYSKGQHINSDDRLILLKKGSYFYFANYKQRQGLTDTSNLIVQYKDEKSIIVVNNDTLQLYSKGFDFYIRKDLYENDKYLIFIRTKSDSFFTYPCSNYFYSQKSNLLGGMADFLQQEGNSIGESKFCNDTTLIINDEKFNCWVLRYKFWNYAKNAYSPFEGEILISNKLLIPLEIKWSYKNEKTEAEVSYKIESLPVSWYK
jgi:hypothetical protein